MLNLDIDRFLRHYWQKQPLFISGGLPDFVDILDEHDLAGLAMESGVDSRIVTQNNGEWQVHNGPFSDFETLCQGQWSLLVQGVEQCIEDSEALLAPFRFIPNWRIDDLMVSFSVPGAGVGAHVDQYDVFIIQGKGKRRWTVGAQYIQAQNSFSPHPKLHQVPEFEPIIDVEMQPGDILYIPPGFPHHGVTLEDCLNYSVGFRAPTQQQILSGFSDYLIDNNLAKRFYQDPDIKRRQHAVEITDEEVQRLRDTAIAQINSPAFASWCSQYFSENPATFAQPSSAAYLQPQVLEALQQGNLLQRELGLRISAYRDPVRGLQLGINGEAYQYQGPHCDLLLAFLDADTVGIEGHPFPQALQQDDQAMMLITQWLNAGLWFFDEADE